MLWIGIKLLIPEEEHHGANIKADTHLWGAIKTIIIADFVMSLDNVIGVAGAAKGNFGLLIFGLLISIPMIVWSSQLILKLMDRYPVIIVMGGALLGFVAGEMLMTDTVVTNWAEAQPHWVHWIVPAMGGLLVGSCRQVVRCAPSGGKKSWLSGDYCCKSGRSENIWQSRKKY